MDALEKASKSPLGQVEIVEAGPKNVPHVVSGVSYDGKDLCFRGPTLPDKSPEYKVEGPIENRKMAVRRALEERLYGCLYSNVEDEVTAPAGVA